MHASTSNDDETGFQRIVLGTVQLGMPYARRRHEGLLDEATAGEILDVAFQKGIRAFDTAEAYGSAAERLDSWMTSRGVRSECHVITKVAPESLNDPAVIERAARRFDGVSSLRILSHGPSPPDSFSRFATFAGSLGCAVGQSVYAADEIRAAALAGADRVQAPVNVLDYRQIDAAREVGIELDGRSIYLQGILLESPEVAERRVPGIGDTVREIQEAAGRCGLRPATALLASVMAKLGPGDRIVVGVDSAGHVLDMEDAFAVGRESIDAFSEELRGKRRWLMEHGELLDPRTWRAG